MREIIVPCVVAYKAEEAGTYSALCEQEVAFMIAVSNRYSNPTEVNIVVCGKGSNPACGQISAC